MRSRLISLLTVIGAVTVLVLAGNTVALAATGKGFLLGKINTATKVSVIKRTTPGSALKVVTKSPANAPLQVNGTGKVANLNADTVDGLDSTAFAPASVSATAAALAAKAPIATGFVTGGPGGTTPSFRHQTGSGSVTWNGSGYVISLPGVAYSYQDYLTVVTSVCADPPAHSVSSVGNNLLIRFNGGSPSCAAGFGYAVYQL